MNLYTLIFESGKEEEIIILNRNFTKEQLRAQLNKMEHISEKYVNYIIEAGQYIEPNCELRITAESAGTITTQRYGSTSYFYKMGEIVVKPNAEFEIIPHFIKK